VVFITLKISQFADVAARDLLMVLAEGKNAKRKIDSVSIWRIDKSSAGRSIMEKFR
jgi:hypothetical protein